MPENLKDRLWVDGCFDFFHHGHAGALMQARQLGTELYVGIHSDEEIARNKGPVVMHQDEREKAVNACKWATKCIPDSPYVTEPAYMDSFRCQYVVHGDDITTDANGHDCYQEVKDLGRFLVVKRTPNISTTDLIGRMLSSSKAHHLVPLTSANRAHFLLEDSSMQRLKAYATDASAKAPHAGVYALVDGTCLEQLVAPSSAVKAGLVQSVYYVDGSFDLFHPGHMEFLEQVHKRAAAAGAVVVVGLMDDSTVNQSVGENYPVMNMFERSLCCLQCKYVDTVIMGVPFAANETFITLLRASGLNITKVLRGPTLITRNQGDVRASPVPATYLLREDLYLEIPPSDYEYMDTGEIVTRVLNHRRVYEERQRKKGVKSEREKIMVN